MSTASLPLRWLGEPLLDAGLASLLIHADKTDPSTLTQTDWQEWLAEIKADYDQRVLDRLLSVAFTQNGFNNPSWKGSARTQKLDEIFDLALGKDVPISSNSDPRPAPGEKCAFYPSEPAVILVGRDRFPLLPERNGMNFTPNGEGFIPLSTWALGCVLGFMYVAPLISGRFLLPACIDGNLLRWIAEELQNGYVQPLLTLARTSQKLEIRQPLSRFGEVLSFVLSRGGGISGATDSGKDPKQQDLRIPPMLVFYFSNSGQDPFAEVYRYRSEVLTFLSRVQAQRYQRAWNAFLHSFWVITEKKKALTLPEQIQEVTDLLTLNGKSTEEVKRFESKNLVYEALPTLPLKAPEFIRHFFKAYTYRSVKQARLHARGQEILLPYIAYTPIWEVLELFAETFFLTMTQQKIDLIKRLAKDLATLITSGIEPHAWKELLGIGSTKVNSYHQWRTLLIRLLRKAAGSQNELLFTLDEYLLLFESAENLPEADWRLTRDLLQIALIEELHKQGFFQKDPSALQALSETSETEETEIL